MTRTEIANLIALDGRCGYNDAAKSEFKKLSTKLLRALAASVSGKVSYNPAGIACSGDASLHSETLHVFFNADSGMGICGRTCKGASDYQGGPNRWFPFSRLAETGMDGMVAWAKGVQAESTETVSTL